MCGLAEDSGICSKWGQSYCELYTNVRAEYCPYMCNVCIGKLSLLFLQDTDCTSNTNELTIRSNRLLNEEGNVYDLWY